MNEATESKLFRLLYVILFYLIFSVMDIVMIVITVIQAALHVLTDEPSDTLRRFGVNLAEYLKQVTEYLSHASEHKPYPFSDWPSVDQEFDDASDSAE